MRHALLYVLLSLQLILKAGQEKVVVVDVLGQDKGFARLNYVSMTQDKAGFLWLSTQTGLIQYSGSAARRFIPGMPGLTALKAEFFYQAFEDNRENLWLASRNGFYMLSPDRKSLKAFFSRGDQPNSLPNNRIFSILPYNDSVLFLACDRSGIVRFNMLTHTISQPKTIARDPDIDIDHLWVRQYYKQSDTCLYLRTSEGFYQYNPVTNEIGYIRETTGGKYSIVGIATLFNDAGGAFWFTSPSGEIFRWEPGRAPQGFRHTELLSLVRKGEIRFFDYDVENLLLSTISGNYLFEKASGKLTRLLFRNYLTDALSNEPVVAATRTTDNNLFLAFQSGYLVQVREQQQAFVYKELVSKDHPPVNVAFMLDDTVYRKRYITSYHSDVFYVEDLGNGRITTIRKPWPGRISANKIIPDKQGRIWACQGEGVVEIDRRSGKLRQFKPDEPARMLFDIVETTPGRFYVGSFRNGLYYFEPDAGIFRKVPETNGWISTQVFSLFYDSTNHRLWIGTVRNGLFVYDLAGESFRQFIPDPQHEHSVGGDWIRSFVADDEGYLWMTADPTGMSRIHLSIPSDSAFDNFSISEGLPSNHVSGLVKDRNGMLWISSLNGLASINPVSHVVRSWEVEQGAYDHRFHYANMSLAHDGAILAGTERGYLRFLPGRLLPDTTPPRVYLTGLEVTDERQQKISLSTNGEKLQLAHYQNNINISFAIVNFNDPDRNHVFYQLQGGGQGWQPIDQRSQIYFSGMAPGNYIFRLRAQNGDGVWSANEIVLPIQILPPVWQTWWFRSGVVILIIALIIMAFRYRLNNLLRQNRLETEKQMLKSEMESQMAALEMKALRAQMNPHFIFNCLNSINRFIIVNDNDTASEYLTRFSRLIRMVLDNARSEKISLEREIETLKLYIDMEKLRFVDRFHFEIFIDPQLNLQHTLIQPMMVQPYVENAIWHGLMPRQEGGLLKLSFRLSDNKLMVSVEDNGIGRQRSQAMKTMQRLPQRSHGMRVTAERLALLNARANAKAEIHVTDLFTPGNLPCGTRVDLVFPVETTEKQLIDDN